MQVGRDLELGVGGNVTHDVINSAGNVLNVLAREPAHVDAARAQQVDVVLAHHHVTLRT
jgi:putative NIF3 family GTP cyclohydrolase 1 type 2